VNRQQPLADRQVRVFEDRLDRDGELFPAGAALVETLARLAALLRVDRVRLHAAAVRTRRMTAPTPLL